MPRRPTPIIAPWLALAIFGFACAAAGTTAALFFGAS